MSDFTKRVVLETDEAEKDLKELSKASKEAGAAFKGLDAQSRTLQRSLDDFDKVASKTSTSTFAAFKSGMKSIGDVMTPLNQGFELAGKVVRGAEAALDAYAQKSPVAAREVAKLKGEFAALADTVKATAGELIVMTMKSIPPLNELQMTLSKMSQTGDDLERAFKQGGFQAWADKTLEIAKNEASSPGLLGGIWKNFGDGLRQNVDFWNTDGKTFIDSFLDGMQKSRKEMEEWGLATPELIRETKRLAALYEGMPDIGDSIDKFANDYAKYQLAQTEKATARALQRAKENRKIADALLGSGNARGAESHRFGMTAEEEREIQRANALYQVEQEEAETARRAVDFGGAMGSLSESGSALAEMRETLRQLQDDKNKSLLESAFGPIEQFDLYKNSVEQLGNAFAAFGTAVGAGYEAIVTGQGSVSAAFKKIFADSLMAMGKESAIASLRETALGFGSLALGPLGGTSAAMHFKAAALHGIVAVTAGAAAHSLGTSAQVAATEKAAAEKDKEEEKAKKEQEKKDKSRGGSGGASGHGDSEARPIYVILGEHFGEMSARERRARVDEQVARAIRERDE